MSQNCVPAEVPLASPGMRTSDAAFDSLLRNVLGKNNILTTSQAQSDIQRCIKLLQKSIEMNSVPGSSSLEAQAAYVMGQAAFEECSKQYFAGGASSLLGTTAAPNPLLGMTVAPTSSTLAWPQQVTSTSRDSSLISSWRLESSHPLGLANATTTVWPRNGEVVGQDSRDSRFQSSTPSSSSLKNPPTSFVVHEVGQPLAMSNVVQHEAARKHLSHDSVSECFKLSAPSAPWQGGNFSRHSQDLDGLGGYPAKAAKTAARSKHEEKDDKERKKKDMNDGHGWRRGAAGGLSLQQIQKIAGSDYSSLSYEWSKKLVGSSMAENSAESDDSSCAQANSVTCSASSSSGASDGPPSDHGQPGHNISMTQSAFMDFLADMAARGVIVRQILKQEGAQDLVVGFTVVDGKLEEWKQLRKEWFMEGKEGQIYRPNSLHQVLRRRGYFPTMKARRTSHGYDFEDSMSYVLDQRRCYAKKKKRTNCSSIYGDYERESTRVPKRRMSDF